MLCRLGSAEAWLECPALLAPAMVLRFSPPARRCVGGLGGGRRGEESLGFRGGNSGGTSSPGMTNSI